MATSSNTTAQSNTDTESDGVWLANSAGDDWLTEFAEEEIQNTSEFTPDVIYEIPNLSEFIPDEGDAYMETFDHVLLAGESPHLDEETILFDSGASCPHVTLSE
ncbi:hypothetical protein EDD17DRAFT_1511163 [Pisolithus thermaeus]|nr:hypothetical protein EDD17DRAFT_1511163 [Pisolithus thermaeus]